MVRSFHSKGTGKMTSLGIIIPLFNKDNNIEKCVLSILAQSLAPDRIVIVDDGSTDNSLTIARRLSNYSSLISILSQQNNGPSEARNIGAKHCDTDLFVFLDADDTLNPEAVEHFVHSYDSKPFDLLVASFSEHYGCNDDKYFNILERLAIDDANGVIFIDRFNAVLAIHIASGSYCVNRDLFNAASGFDTTLRCWEVTDFLHSALLKSRSTFASDTFVLTVNKAVSNSLFKIQSTNSDDRITYLRSLLSRLPKTPHDEWSRFVPAIEDTLWFLLKRHQYHQFLFFSNAAHKYVNSAKLKMYSHLPFVLLVSARGVINFLRSRKIVRDLGVDRDEHL